VKIDLDESGTGLIVGESNSDYYILTAKHVIVNSKLNIIEAGDLDLAIFSYPKSKISSTVNKRIVIGRANLSDCYLGQDVQALGYMAGSKSLDIVSSKIQSINPYGVSEFFLSGLGGFKSGFSGSPAFNNIGELIGIAIEIDPSGATVTFIKINEVLRLFDGKYRNFLVESNLIGTWRLAGVFYGKDRIVQQVFNGNNFGGFLNKQMDERDLDMRGYYIDRMLGDVARQRELNPHINFFSNEDVLLTFGNNGKIKSSTITNNSWQGYTSIIYYLNSYCVLNNNEMKLFAPGFMDSRQRETAANFELLERLGVLKIIYGDGEYSKTELLLLKQ